MIQSRVHPKKISLQLLHDPSEFGRVISFRQGGMTNVESPYIRTVPSHHGSPILSGVDKGYAGERPHTPNQNKIMVKIIPAFP